VDIVAILMGWPSLIAALLLSATGTWLGKPVLVWTAVVLIVPMAFYLSGSPAYPFVGIVPVIALVMSALTCRKPGSWLRFAGIGIYLTFYLTFIAALAFVVIFQE
jgi:predicted membrane channel-forming protein YqfA (hemolysin III family)